MVPQAACRPSSLRAGLIYSVRPKKEGLVSVKVVSKVVSKVDHVTSSFASRQTLAAQS
jgi:hypothetical protein